LKSNIRKLRFLIGIIILGSLGLVAVMAWRTMEAKEGKEPVKEIPVAADLQLNRVKYTETRDGIKEWELEAASVRYFKEENTVWLEKVKATFFGKNEEVYTLVGEQGKFNTQTKAIEVYGGVKLDSNEGYRMRTQSLKYLAEKRELSTPDPVEMKGPQFNIEGTGLIVDLERQCLKVLHKVTTNFSHQGKKPASTSL